MGLGDLTLLTNLSMSGFGVGPRSDTITNKTRFYSRQTYRFRRRSGLQGHGSRGSSGTGRVNIPKSVHHAGMSKM